MKCLSKLGIVGLACVFFNPYNALALDLNKVAYQPGLPLHPDTINSPGSPRFLDGYGQTVALKKSDHMSGDGEYLFVAAPFSRPGAGLVVSGTIYVYKRDKVTGLWNELQKIETKGMSDHLGAIDVEAQGDWLMFSAVGTPIAPIDPVANDTLSNQNFQGSVQIYRFNNSTGLYEFSQALDSMTPGLDKLTAGVNPTNPFFTNEQGASFGLHFGLDANNGRLLVGAEYQMNDLTHINSGAVYGFDLDNKSKTWVLTQTITSPDGIKANDTFGYNVRLLDKVAIVGNGPIFQGPKFGPVAANGAVYVYNYDNATKSWQFNGQKLTGDQQSLPLAFTLSNTVLPMGDSFGASMALAKHWAMIGAPLESSNASFASYSGAVYMYTVNSDGTLTKTQKITSDDPLSYMTGFIHLDLDGDTAVIADPGRTGNNGDYQGGAMVYKLKQNQWIQVATLTDNGGGQYSFFGGSVSIDGKRIAVGGIPFGGIVLVAFRFYVGPPFHRSLLLPPALVNPSLSLAATPVIVFDEK